MVEVDVEAEVLEVLVDCDVLVDWEVLLVEVESDVL